MLLSKIQACDSDRQTRARALSSQIELYRLEMPPHSLYLRVFSGCVTLDTVSPCPVVTQLSAISVIRGHNVLSVFQQCPKRHSSWLTPPTLPALPEHTPLSHTVLHCQSLGDGGILGGKWSQKGIWAVRTSHSILDHTLRWAEEKELTFDRWITIWKQARAL